VCASRPVSHYGFSRYLKSLEFASSEEEAARKVGKTRVARDLLKRFNSCGQRGRVRGAVDGSAGAMNAGSRRKSVERITLH